jgi:hypothetical protein
MRAVGVLVAILAVAVLVLCTVTASAEERGGTRIERLLPESDGIAKLGYSYNSRADVRGEPGSTALHLFRFKGAFPIPLGEKVIFSPGVYFDLFHFRLYNLLTYLSQNSLSVYDIGPTFDVHVGLNDNWIMSFGFQPLISSDLKGFGWKDIQFKGYGLAAWAFHDYASFIFGVGVGKEFWRYLPIPIIGFVVRKPGSFFSFEMIAPKYARADFRVASFCKLFVQGEFEGDVWYIRGDAGVPNHHGKFMDTHAGAGARFTLYRGIDLEAWGGVNPYRRAEFKDATGQTLARRLDMAYFGEANLIITPDIFGK